MGGQFVFVAASPSAVATCIAKDAEEQVFPKIAK